MNRRVDADVDRVWEQFHAVVNMTSEQLRGFLLARAAGEDGAFPDEPDLGVDPEGRAILKVLAKRRVDLTDVDLDLMERVTEQVTNLLAVRLPDGVADDQWREDLMSLGHDPMRPGSPAAEG